MTERIVLTGHQVEAMARQKVLKPPEFYLDSRRRRRRAGERSVVAALLQAEKRGLNVTVRRLPPPRKE